MTRPWAIVWSAVWRGRHGRTVSSIGVLTAAVVGWSALHHPPALILFGGPYRQGADVQGRLGTPWLWLFEYTLFVWTVGQIVTSVGARDVVALQRIRGIAPGRWAMAQLMASGLLAVAWVIGLTVAATALAALRGGDISIPWFDLALFAAGLWATAGPLVASQRFLGDARTGLLLAGLLIIGATSGPPLMYWTPFAYAMTGMGAHATWGVCIVVLTGWTTVWGLLLSQVAPGTVWVTFTSER